MLTCYFSAGQKSFLIGVFPSDLFFMCNSVDITWLPVLSVLTCFVSYFKTLIRPVGVRVHTCVYMCVCFIPMRGTSTSSTYFPWAALIHAHSIKLMPMWTHLLATIFLLAMCGQIRCILALNI